MMNSKYFWLPALIIVIIAAIGVVFYVPDQNTSLTDTSTWPIYRNEKYGFMMKYPPEWKVTESGDLEHDVINFFAPESAGLDELSNYYILDIFNDNLEKISESFIGDSEDPRYIYIGNEKHNEIDMMKYHSDLSSENKRSHYFFQRNGITFVFHSHSPFAEPMLDSFVFLK